VDPDRPVAPSRRTRAAVAVGIGLALLLAACDSTGPALGASPSATATTDVGGTESPEPSPTPTVTPLSREEYIVELGRAAGRVRAAFDLVKRARSYNGLGVRLVRARTSVGRATDALAALTPPEDAAAVHDQFIDALSGYAAVLVNLAGDVDTREVCGAPSAMARLGQAGAGRRLRAATRGLARAGYRLGGAIAPPPKPLPGRSLRTGTFIISGVRTGRGTLTIRNRQQLDGVVTLTANRSQAPAISVYVTGRSKYTVRGVRDGRYTAYTTQGADWDRDLGTFTRRCTFFRFASPLTYTTSFTSSAIRYTTWTLTLGGSRGGGGTDAIDPDDFPG
jgi:hypothetical protein